MLQRNESVGVVNEALANILFPNQDPIGQRVILWNLSFARGASRPGSPSWASWRTRLPARSLRRARAPKLYMPMFASREMNIAPTARRNELCGSYGGTSIGPDGAQCAPRSAKIDVTLALAHVRTLQNILDRASAQTAFAMVLLAVAAGVALMLGVIGIYGVTSYIVTQTDG